MSPTGLHIRVSDGTRTFSLSGAEFVADETYAQPHSGWHTVADVGTMTIGFSLRTADSEIVSSGMVSIPLRHDWAWDVQFHISNSDPMKRCLGCEGSTEFELKGAPEKSVYVVWGGNSISSPVVY